MWVGVEKSENIYYILLPINTSYFLFVDYKLSTYMSRIEIKFVKSFLLLIWFKVLVG
jgi:hypothetical protein